jgi:hypothetical protein
LGEGVRGKAGAAVGCSREGGATRHNVNGGGASGLAGGGVEGTELVLVEKTRGRRICLRGRR